MRILFTAFILLVTSLCTFAQNERLPVELSHTGEDVVGQRLAFEVREAIRGSQGMRLVTRSEADPRIVVSLVTIEGSSGNRGASTAAAITIALDGNRYPLAGLYLVTVVQTCGTNRVRECARDIAGDIDSQLEFLKREWPSYAAELRQARPRN